MIRQGCGRPLITLAVIGALSVAVACDTTAQTDQRLAGDSVVATLTTLEPRLEPYFAQLDSMTAALRRDSGTVRADTAYLRWHDALTATLRPLTPLLMEDPRFRGDSIARRLRSRGIWAYEAEGSPYFVVSDPYLLERVGRFLTLPMHEHVSFWALALQRPPAGDGSILIGWDEFFERLAATEGLLERHPDYAGAQRLREQSDWYLQFALHGGENSSVFDRRTRALDPAIRARYERYAASHPASPAGKVIAQYLRLLAANGYRRTPAVVAFQREVSGHP